jgi:hypothetical protein
MLGNMMNIANPLWNIVLVDDTNCGRSYCVDKAVQLHINENHLKKLVIYSLDGGRRGFTLLHYTHSNRTDTSHWRPVSNIPDNMQ